MKRTPLPLAGVIAGAQAAISGIAIVFAALILVWLVASHGDDSALSVLRASGPVWLASHLVPVTLGGSPLGVLPMLAMALPAYFLRRGYQAAVRACTPDDRYEYVLLAGFQTATYATVAVAVSALMRSADLYADSPRAFAQTAVFAMVVTGWSSLPTLPAWAADSVRAGVATSALLVTAGAVLVTVALVARMSQVAALTGAMAAGVIDAVALTVLAAAYVPNAAVWAVSYVLGPGFAFGASHQVTVFDASMGRVPAFPLLATLPTSAPALGKALLALPVLAGIALYAFTPRTVRASLVAIGTTVATITALSWLAGGALGKDQLATVGPDALSVALAGLEVIGGTFAVVAIVPRVLLVLLRSRGA